MTASPAASETLTPELLRAAFAADRDLVVLTDDVGRVQWVSPSVTSLLGWGEEQFHHVGNHLVHPADEAAHDEAVGVALAAPGCHHLGAVRLLAADGDFVPFDLTITNLVADHGVLLLRHRDLRQAVERPADAPLVVDEVTGLPQRGTLRRALERRLRSTRQRVAVLFCDLDGFKAVNDRFGHAAGDDVLREVADRLQRRLRDTELLARWGGDEFVVLVEVPGQALATTVAARLHHAVADEPFLVDGVAVHLGVSIGVGIGEAGSDVDALVHDADRAMYRAKRDGGGVVMAAEEAA